MIDLLYFYLIGSILMATATFWYAIKEEWSLQDTFYCVIISYLLSWFLGIITLFKFEK